MWNSNVCQKIWALSLFLQIKTGLNSRVKSCKTLHMNSSRGFLSGTNLMDLSPDVCRPSVRRLDKVRFALTGLCFWGTWVPQVTKFCLWVFVEKTFSYKLKCREPRVSWLGTFEFLIIFLEHSLDYALRWLINTFVVLFTSGKADKHLCEAVIYELHQAVLKTTDDPIRQAWQTIAVVS